MSIAQQRLTLHPLPTRAQYGAEPRLGVTDPTRYGTTSNSRRYNEPTNPRLAARLPSLNTILIPELQPSSQVPRAPSIGDSETYQSSHYDRYEYVGHPSRYSDTHPAPLQYSPQRRDSRGTSNESRRDSMQSIGSASIITGSRHQQGLGHLERDASSYPNGTDSFQHQGPMPSSSSPAHAPYRGISSNSTAGKSPTSLSGYNTVDAQTPTKPLLQVVGEENVPGEGPCYIYADGSRLRKIIDGEAVNAQWGVTKAGKPRKRLAIACLTCREKKIKCEPGEPKCMQCEKSGRECRFHTAPRGQSVVSMSPSYEIQARTPFPTSPRRESHFDSLHSPIVDTPDTFQDSVHRRSLSIDSISMQFEPTLSEISSMQGSKWHSSDAACRTPESQFSDSVYKLSPPIETTLKHTMGGNLGFDWGRDPFEVDPSVALHHMNMYFTHINCGNYRIFPQKCFFQWFRFSRNKSPDELMVVYSMLTLGSVFSPRKEAKVEEGTFCKIAVRSVEKNYGAFSLQLAQSRLILSLYFYAVGDMTKSSDFTGSALRCTSALRLNLEASIADRINSGTFDFGLDRHALAECHRRTYWSTFLLDRYNGYCSGLLETISKVDSYVRLPCWDEAYEDQRETAAPYLDDIIVDEYKPIPRMARLGIMAYHIQLLSLWGDIMTQIYRSKHRPETSFSEYEDFYVKMDRRLTTWYTSLPRNILGNSSNLLQDGSLGAIASTHSLYHVAHMMLNRYVRHANLPPASIHRNIREAYRHAELLLQEMRTLGNLLEETGIDFATPVCSYALVCAIDIITAAGPLQTSFLSKTVQLLRAGYEVVERLAQYWSTAKTQLGIIKRRIETLVTSARDVSNSKTSWRFNKSLDHSSNDHDLLYMNNDGTMVFKSLGIEGMHGSVLYLEEAITQIKDVHMGDE